MKYDSFKKWFPKSGFIACGALTGTVLAGRIEAIDGPNWYDS